MRFATFILALIPGLAVAEEFVFDAVLLERPGVREFFSELMKSSGHGRLGVERGGFLRQLTDGRYQGAPWPLTREFQAATFAGHIPPGTIAVVHTHPASIPRPSVHDLEQARRLGLPIIVLTPRNITVAAADGKIHTVIRRKFW